MLHKRLHPADAPAIEIAGTSAVATHAEQARQLLLKTGCPLGALRYEVEYRHSCASRLRAGDGIWRTDDKRAACFAASTSNVKLSVTQNRALAVALARGSWVPDEIAARIF
jgi:hypothetical protein